MNALELSHIAKKFGTAHVLTDLTCAIPEHSIFGFLGQNGAGKTTTMKLILGLLKADTGKMKVFGQSVSYGQTKTNRMIGYLPDVPEFYPYMTPMEYLKLCGEIAGMPAGDIRSRSLELLELTGLAGCHKRIGGFSRGMKQRLGIAQALLHKPKLLICDEPTSALDPVGRKEILDILQQVKGQSTVLFSTHILTDVEKICDHAAILHQGKIALESSLKELHTKHGVSQLLVGFSSGRELSRFCDAPQIRPYLTGQNTDSRDTEVLLASADLDQASRDTIAVLHETRLIPRKLERTEPSLEKLFMEVVK